MQLPFVGHSKSCKNEMKSLVFSVNDLLYHFLFYLSLSLLIEIFLVFWFKNKTLLSSVQFNRSVMSNSLRPHESEHARPPCPSSTPVYPNSCPLSRWCHPAISSSCLPLLLLPLFPPSIRVFSSESTLHMRWPKYWSFSFSISPSNEQPGLISFRMDWLDLLAVQGTLKSLLQHRRSKASILQRSAHTATCEQL